MTRDLAKAQEFVSRIRREPSWFMRHALGVPVITPQQHRVIDSVRDNRRTAAPSGHGLGKTFIAALIVIWFLYANHGAKVVTTAPTWHQVKNLLWREIRRAHAHAPTPLGGVVTTTGLQLGDEWFAIGQSTNDATRFQGIHAPRVLVVFDEATGVMPAIWEASEGLAVGPDDRFLAIGNPTDPTSQFKVAEDSGLWNVVRLNAEEHPNVLENKIVVPGAVTREWVEEREREYGGRESNLYRARVRGLWPEQGDDVLIAQKWVEDARERQQKMGGNPDGQPVAVGCDVARFGSDETIAFRIYADARVALPYVRRGQDLMGTAGYLKQLGVRKLGVDDAGLGGGVTDRLREQSVHVVATLGGESATDDEMFVNRRAEMWWAMREELRVGALHLPNDPKLFADLTNVKYGYDSRGRIKLESKDDIRERLGRSPDRGDALAIAVWVWKERGLTRATQIKMPRR